MPVPVSRLLACGLALACAEAEPAIELGTGEIEFEPLSDGGEIEVVRGPQGGYHLLGSVRVAGIDPGNTEDLSDRSNPTTTFQVFEGERSLAPFASFTQGIGEGSSAQWPYEMIGRLVVLDIDSDAELDGHQVRFEVQVRSAGGVELTDARTLTVVPHPLNDNTP
jgi:hypothetical protein